MKELISVIINVYNGEKFINKCLDSIVNQTYKNIEILIVNDGSTDNTLEIIKQYKDKRIRVINQKNMGLSLARNVGIDNANGQYLYFVDVDDFIELDTIEYLYNQIKKYNVKMAACNALEIFNYDFKCHNKKEKISVLTTEEMLSKHVLSIDYTIDIWNKLIKKEVFDNIRFEDRIINDLATTYKYIMNTDKIVYSNQIKYYYLRNSESVTVKNKKELYRNIDIYNVSIDRYNYIKEYYPDLLANKVGLLINIVHLYTLRNKELHRYLDKYGAKELFKELFSLKILTFKMKLKDKVIVILFRISPKLYEFILNIFLEIKYEIIGKKYDY